MGKKLICIAHRGASGHEPENTLAAFEKAIALGADWIELDLFAIENRLVVIHDNTLERTTSGKGWVTDHNLAYLRGLDAGKGNRIPFFTEILDLVARRTGVNAELKGPDTAVPLVEVVNKYVRQHGWSYKDFLVSSFDHRQIKTTKMLQPSLPVGLNINGVPLHLDRLVGELSPWSLHVSLDFASKELIADIHALGCKAFVFTVNTEADLERVKSMGADGIFTNFPELLTGRKA